MGMIGRRGLLAAGASLLAHRAAMALPVPQGDRLSFRVMRHGSEIGQHVLNFDRQGNNLTVRIAVDVVVTFASIPIVRYTHHAVESWEGGLLTGLECQTNHNGQHESMSARRNAQGLVVTGSKTATYVAPENALPTSYWNRAMLGGPMISLEDGVLLRPNEIARGVESVRLASGSTIAATRTDLSGAFDAIVWYDGTGTWASLGLTAADGSDIRYERL
jgi:Domain of unknown function (DUF6134)